jgi:hypothetical protein
MSRIAKFLVEYFVERGSSSMQSKLPLYSSSRVVEQPPAPDISFGNFIGDFRSGSEIRFYSSSLVVHVPAGSVFYWVSNLGLAYYTHIYTILSIKYESIGTTFSTQFIRRALSQDSHGKIQRAPHSRWREI